ncbi:unnamed protein product, partial [Porites evermanni]
LVINECVYKIHPIFNMYAAFKDGQIIHNIKQVQNAGNTNHNGYMAFTIRKYGDKNSKTYRVHRFVWECLNGVIPDGKVIAHINEDREDNRLYNLQIVTQRANCKKSARKRDYTFAANNFQNRRCVKAMNKTTQGVVFFNSMYAVQQRLSINTGIVKMVCEGINNCKTGISKKGAHQYKFEYIQKEDMPDDYKKSANTRPRSRGSPAKKRHQMEILKIWQKRKYICPR